MRKKRLRSLLYFTSILFFPWGIPFLFKKSVEPWVLYWWNTSQFKTFADDIQEKSFLEKLIQLEELLLLDEMLKEYPEPHLQEFRIGIQKETIELIKMHNEEPIHRILDFSTNLISFLILSAYAILGKEELLILNSWLKKFLYNLSDTTKAFFLVFITQFFTGFHSNLFWDPAIHFFAKQLGFPDNENVIILVASLVPTFVDITFKMWIFKYLNGVSRPLVLLYRKIKK